MSFGENLQFYRAREGMTQEELAEAVGVTRQTIISLANGRYNASLLLAHRLAQYFHLTIEELSVFEEDVAQAASPVSK